MKTVSFTDFRNNASSFLDLVEKGVVGVGLKVLAVALGVGPEHACLLESVEFQANSVGGVAKFGLQATQIGPGTAIEEEFQQQFDPRFGRNQCLNHGVSIRIE